MGDVRGPLLFEKVDESLQQGTRVAHLESHRLAQGQVRLKSLMQGSHCTPPGHGAASMPKARSSTLA